jgi:hypothetical protein
MMMLLLLQLLWCMECVNEGKWRAIIKTGRIRTRSKDKSTKYKLQTAYLRSRLHVHDSVYESAYDFMHDLLPKGVGF